MEKEAFEKTRDNTKKFYDSIGYVECPYSKSKIYFTSEGFTHLKYSKKRVRPLKVQEAKLKLVPKGKELLEITTTLQEWCDGLEVVKKKKYKKLVSEPTMIEYYGFVGIIKGTRLKVVVRKVGNRYIFWSTIPLWRSTKYDKYSVIDKSSGDLIND